MNCPSIIRRAAAMRNAGRMWRRFCDHGIAVITAINVQYIREQQDAVERITGKRAALQRAGEVPARGR